MNHVYLPLEITLLSTHQSPNTVNKNANELVIGTVRLSSINLLDMAFQFTESQGLHISRIMRKRLTRLTNQQEEPD